MDQGALLERLAAAGLRATETDLGSTIRPTLDANAATAALDLGTEDTIASTSAPPPRALPHITVDLRGSMAPAGPATKTSDLEVRGLLGEGGMGRVLLAHQHSLARDVAVKTAKDGAPDSARNALIFEGVITGQLEHPAIVPVHALGVDHAGRPAMVMKRVEGVTWDTLLQDADHEGWEGWEGTPEDRLPGHIQILVQVCNAVHFAHSRRIVHRDLKPENVLIGRFGDVYVADWGIAARMDEDTDRRLCGTPGYMAPEMVRGIRVDARTDVYLLGAVLHEVLTGSRRHDAPTSVAALTMALISDRIEYDAAVPDELADISNRACNGDPERRHASALEFRDAVTGFLKHRDSVRLQHEATERLVRLRELHGGSPDESERREIDRLAAEARFGLERALEGWGENEDARAALDELESILEERRQRAAELELLARERDPSVGERHRNRGLAILALLGIAAGVVGWTQQEQPSALQLVVFGAGMTGVLAVITVLFRRQVLRNTFGRQSIGMLFLAAVLLLVPRIFELGSSDFDPADALVRDSMVLAAVTAMGALTLMRWVFVIALVFLAGALGIMAFPESALRVFSLSAGTAIVLAAVLARVFRSEIAET